jgi:hypothetical protein
MKEILEMKKSELMEALGLREAKEEGMVFLFNKRGHAVDLVDALLDDGDGDFNGIMTIEDAEVDKKKPTLFVLPWGNPTSGALKNFIGWMDRVVGAELVAKCTQADFRKGNY